MGRRANGEGSKPYQVSKGRWRADVTVGTDPITGKRIRKPVYGRSQALCAAARRDLIRQVEDGAVTIGSAPTLQEWLDHWLYVIKKETLRDSTLEGYEAKIAWLKNTKLARTKLDKLNPEHIETFYARKRAEGRAVASVLQLHRILNGAFKAAVKRGRLGSNPLLKVDAPSGRSDEAFVPPTFTPEDARKIIAHAETLPPSEAARWMMALTYGPRQGEILGLGWDAVDLDSGQIDLRRTLYPKKWRHGCDDRSRCPAKGPHLCPSRHGGGLFFGTPKSQAGRRSVPVPKQVLKHLKKLHAEHLALNAAEGERRQQYTDPNGVTVDLVFCQLNGRPHRPESDWRRWEALLEECGVGHRRLHDARHVSATMMLTLGIDARVVMDLMGWSQRAMLDRYQHVLDDMKRDVAAQVGNALWAHPKSPEDPNPEPGDDIKEGPSSDTTVINFDEWKQRRTG
ncbi:tyrosine-type recombinase/integrase [Nesterenkonia sphaerica]|uniref:Site-specific integrase n=1 Tax=Nesterenkonia sphaerica TaxID=1804988 RepID=A0A5R9A6Y5_9MICC|nr:site-specific integrase [Nesterenkonia sphaerica]TLP74451.1 site-specific integrase [Nesterenkonia sphaerica]